MHFTQGPLRAAVEGAVSAHTGRAWAIQSARDMSEYACHPCALLAGEGCGVFAKFSDAANAREQFEIELAGLSLLARRAGVLIPSPLGVLDVPGGSVLLLEAVQAVERGAHEWRDIGRTLARVHKVHGARFGLETQGYFGPLPQDNRPAGDWPAFFAERRLWPGLRLAIDSGRLPPVVARQVESLIARVPRLCGPAVAPALLHGDAQKNNFISTARGTVAIDPAVYYGHPEMDLAYVDYFERVPDDVFDGYRDELPIDPGFAERRDLWRVWGYLAAVAVEGEGYLGRLAEAVQKYL